MQSCTLRLAVTAQSMQHHAPDVSLIVTPILFHGQFGLALVMILEERDQLYNKSASLHFNIIKETTVFAVPSIGSCS